MQKKYFLPNVYSIIRPKWPKMLPQKKLSIVAALYAAYLLSCARGVRPALDYVPDKEQKLRAKKLHDQLDKVDKVPLPVGQVGQLCHAFFSSFASDVIRYL